MRDRGSRRTALASTGPRTPTGKARSSKNATRHGALSTTPVIPGLEDLAEWEQHRSAVIASLDVDGYLETTLADRVALQLWRLRRLTRHEIQTIDLATTPPVAETDNETPVGTSR